METPNLAICSFKFCSLPLMTADVFCIVFHEYNLGKMKISDGVEIYNLVLKRY